jgi:hypothetical protein
MKLNVIANGKTGIINLTHSTFIVEDLKAHICKKMGLSIGDYKLKIDFGGDSIELVQTKANPSFSSNQKESTKSKGNLKLAQWEIKEELRKHWRKYKLENDADILSVGKRHLSDDMKHSVNASKLRLAVKANTKTKYTYYVGLKGSEVHYGVLLDEKVQYKKIFDMRDSESINDFFEGALPTDKQLTICRVVNKVANAWATKINSVDTLEEFYSLPLPYEKTTHDFSKEAMSLTIDGIKIELLWMSRSIQFCLLGRRSQYISSYESGNRFQNFKKTQAKDLLIMEANMADYELAKRGV